MTENEVRDFLINSTKNIHISTLDEKGEPNIHPTWYYFDNNNEKIYVESGKDSRKTRNLRRNNIIYYCIDDDTIPYKGVRGKGTVKISEDANYNLPIINKIVTKYLGSTENRLKISQTVLETDLLYSWKFHQGFMLPGIMGNEKYRFLHGFQR
jgi:general stress protein 26